jgi:hypothetical protein
MENISRDNGISILYLDWIPVKPNIISFKIYNKEVNCVATQMAQSARIIIQ